MGWPGQGQGVSGSEACVPTDLDPLYDGLVADFVVVAEPGVPLSAGEMFWMAAVKILMIAMCEGAGFVGGVIYPSLWVGTTVGSGFGALDVVQELGGQYVYM